MIEYHEDGSYTITRRTVEKRQYHGMFELLEIVIDTLNHDGRHALADALVTERKELFFNGAASRG